MDVSVAGITMRLNAGRLMALGEGDEAYTPFCVPVPKATDLVDINVAIAPPRATGQAERLFDGGGAWSLSEAQHRYAYRTAATAPDGTPVLGADFGIQNGKLDAVDLSIHPASVNGGVIGYPARYPLDQILLMYALLERWGLLIHAAGVEIDGRAFVFPGVSGAGKSTISRLFAQAGYADDLLSDDRIALRFDGKAVTAWGTPWPGDAGAARNAGAPLAALLFLVQGDSLRLELLTPTEAAHCLMPVASAPWYDRGAIEQCLGVMDEIVTRTPAYLFTFTNDPGSIRAVKELAYA